MGRGQTVDRAARHTGRCEPCSRSPNDIRHPGSPHRCACQSSRPAGRRSCRFLERSGGHIMKFGTIGAGRSRLRLRGRHWRWPSGGFEQPTWSEIACRQGCCPRAWSVRGHGREAASLDYVLLTVPWPNVEDALRGLPAWNGRVLIDATNPFIEYSPKLCWPTSATRGRAKL